MKNIYSFIAIALFSAVTFISCAPAPYAVVTTRPAAPVIVQPVSPYPGAVWIPGEYRWRGNRYVYINPHYARPRHGRVWISGGWVATRGGYVWRSGYWR